LGKILLSFQCRVNHSMRCAIILPICSHRVVFACRGAVAALLAASFCVFASAQSKPIDAQSSAALPAPSGAAPAHPTPAASDAAKPGDLSKEALVYDKLLTRVREESDGTDSRETTARVRIQAEAGVKNLAVLTFTYTASSQQIDIGYVRVIKPDGTVVVTPAYNIQEMPADVTREAPMYSDVHEKHVAVRGLAVGDTLEYQVTQHTIKPDVPGQFWLEYSFEKNAIVLDEQLDLDLPADKPATVASADVQPTVTTSGNRKIYHWASSNLARPDPDAPPKSVKKWKPSVQVTTFTSWEQIGAWYASLQKDSVVVTPAIQARAAALTKGLTSDEDKLHAIFNDVALHIHYVGLEFGIGRYQPHLADDVLSNEYGDCKDKHTLLAALLKAAGIEAWPVLISSGRYLDPSTPSPAQFDHVITLVSLGGKLRWMDSTEEVVPIDVLAGSLRDKQALAIPTGKPAYLEHTPADLSFPQVNRIQVEGSLSDHGQFTGHFDESFRGDAETIMRAAFRSVPQSQWKVFVQGMLNATGFSGEAKEPQVSSIEATSEPFHIVFDYSREKYGEWDSHRISPPMPFMGGELAPGVKQIKPADDIDLGSPGETVYSSTVHLPEDWLLFPAQATDVAEDWAEYHSQYAFSKGTFTAERRLVVKKDKVPLADWDKYLAFRRAIYDDEVRMDPVTSPDESFSFMNMSPQEQKIHEAIQPLRAAEKILAQEKPAAADVLANTASKATAALDAIEAQSLTLPADDPHSLYMAKALAYAWCVKGWLALESNDLTVAEPYLRAAWLLDQDRPCGLQLGRMLEAKHDKLAAAHQYELAHASFNPGEFEISVDETGKQLTENYHRLTGKSIAEGPVDPRSKNGVSLLEERDRLSEIRGFIHTTQLTGAGLFIVAFEAGKPAKATFLGGDKNFESLLPALRSHTYPAYVPAGSKARLLREVRLVCTPWAGCDAYLLAPGAVETPPTPVRAVQVKSVPSSPSRDAEPVGVVHLQVEP
jgi:hypothetical protein